MAYDPKREDYQRLGLRYIQELDEGDPTAAPRSFAAFGQKFAQDRDSLPQTDADRAFHLVVMAAQVVDYQLPFAGEAQAEALIKRGKELLDEAIQLDPHCYDAIRMRSSTNAPSIEARYRFLAERLDEVRTYCTQAHDDLTERLGLERSALAEGVAMRPYWRWLASLAEGALICGRNREAVGHARELLASDPYDASDVRFTLAYAYAKLEDEKALEDLAAHYPATATMRPADDAWLTLSRIALAHKRCDFDAARAGLRQLLARYRGGALALIRQSELPDGEFARLCVRPYSEDELILAVSEGIVLLQEGDDRSGKGVLGSWIADEVSKLVPTAAAEAARMTTQEAQAQ